jgi:hypothetical protein
MKLKPGQKMKNRHIFRFRMPDGEILPSPAAVTNAKKHVEIALHEDHVIRAIKAHGQGDPSNCAGAACATAHSHFFPHEFSGVEWIDTRAYFITKKKGGLPVEAIVYEHHDNVAKLFDSPAGLKRLLAEIRKNGPKTISLYPVQQSFSGGRNAPSKKDGSRTPVSDVKKSTGKPSTGNRKSTSKKGHEWRIQRTTMGLLPSEREGNGAIDIPAFLKRAA